MDERSDKRISAAVPSKIPLFPVLLVNFIGSLGFSIVLPFLVFVVLKFGGNPVVYGLVGATYPALQLLGAPLQQDRAFAPLPGNA